MQVQAQSVSSSRNTTQLINLTTQQLANRWGLAEATLIGWRHRGIGPVYLKLASRVMYRLEDVEDFEANNLRQSPAQRLQTQGASHE
jgi:adenylosuccinate synthase